MPRCIDADKLEELCDIMAEKCGGIGESIWNQFRTIVEGSLTVDVVEKELYNRLLEDAVIMAEALDEYQTADAVEVKRWIPVSERLPEYAQEVLVTVEGWFEGKMIDRAVDLAIYWQHDSYIDGFETVNDWIECGEWKITAWLPLPEPFPEPYRKETEDGSSIQK